MNYEQNENEYEKLDSGRESSPSVTTDNSIKKQSLFPHNLLSKHGDTKKKRKSKTDCDSGDYVCGCGKKYLLYSSLYSHIRSKHNGKAPEGTNIIQDQSMNGCKRKKLLRKEAQIPSSKKEPFKQKQLHEEFISELKGDFSSGNINNVGNKDNEHNYFSIYSSFGLLNNSIQFDQRDISSANSKYSIDEIKGIAGYEQLRIQVEIISKAIKDNEGSAIKKDITCDMAIGMFLVELSRLVTPEFYKMILILLKHYRDCMNKLGWGILSQHRHLHNEEISKDYCSIIDPFHLPVIANNFLNEYLPDNLPKYDRYFAVIIISHFNLWLFKTNHTTINLKLKSAH